MGEAFQLDILLLGKGRYIVKEEEMVIHPLY